MTTLKDLSKKTGVSVTTISRVLNHDETIAVSRETNRAIFEAAYELGYQPPRKRKKLEKSLLIGVADWRILVDGRECSSINSLRYFAESDVSNQSVEFVRIAKGEVQAVDGIIAFSDLTQEEIACLRLSSPFIVFVNGGEQCRTYDQILVDLDASMTRAFDYLINHKGIRNIGYISGRFEGDGYAIGERRKSKVISLLKENGLYHETLIKIGDFSEQSGYILTEEILKEKTRPQALIVGSDSIAKGVIHALSDQGVQIPQDISIVIYQDIRTTQLPNVDVAMILAYPDILWQKAIQMIIELTRGRTEQVTTVISPQLLFMEQ
ncbi:MAG TPA: LacI family DNA-binding transcriptional regulator [Clostridia bacterium]|nr:LacI family DNA-binding transcriptional regulator [Clostridia bacterium]